jgi:energy-coupling factor transport system ATP-binding protein
MRTSSPGELGGAVGYVPQQAITLFFKERVIDELAFTARIRGGQVDIDATLHRFDLALHANRHPLDLSGGERERAALATVMIGQPRLLLLDEPTRGMDAWKKAELGAHLVQLQREGVAIVMVTHDAEMVARFATRVAMLAGKQLIADGAPRLVLSGSSAYATQVNKTFGGEWLTVGDVLAGNLA